MPTPKATRATLALLALSTAALIFLWPTAQHHAIPAELLHHPSQATPHQQESPLQSAVLPEDHATTRTGKNSDVAAPLPGNGTIAAGPVGTTLHLDDSGVNKGLKSRYRLSDGTERCPNKYIFVNTHTFGRHHNQLQELLNIALWSRELGRTAVLGWFRAHHKWVNPRLLYNFTAIMRHYCLITPEDFASRVKKELAKRAAATGGSSGKIADATCYGQGIDDTLLRKYVGKMLRCAMHKGIPSHYNSRLGVKITAGFLSQFILPNTKDFFVGVSGEIGFFMRKGLPEHASIFGLLEPANEIRKEVDDFIQQSFGNNAGDIEEGDNAFFAIHVRQREKECMKEVNHSFIDGGAPLPSKPPEGVKQEGGTATPPATATAIRGVEAPSLGTMTSNDMQVIRTQCAMTMSYVQALLKSLKLHTGSSNSSGKSGAGEDSSMRHPIPLFVASDKQNKALDGALKAAGGVSYGGTYTKSQTMSLEALAVDFFIMTRARYFSGNQLSSISQNVCFVRLGRGRACHGFVPLFSWYHARQPPVNVPLSHRVNNRHD